MLDHIRLLNIFVVKVEEILIGFVCLPRVDRNVFQSCEIVQLENKRCSKSFIFVAVRKFDEGLLTFFKKETRAQIVVFG